jgi:poly(A) polymerase
MDQTVSPRIVSRTAHPISRKYIDSDALRVLYRLHHHGFAAFLVGGCVRDLLLEKIPKDFDVATDAYPRQVRDLFRSSRLIGRRFRLARIYFPGGKFIEVSTFRRRSEFDPSNQENHLSSDNTFGTPAEDAFRRDITINGVFYNLADFSLVDYVGGLEDLRLGLIRCIGDPEEKFVHDPVRMIRVIRHAARTGFAIVESTYRSLLSHVEEIRFCSPARVRDEFLRELREGSAGESMRLMIETGMLFALFPSFLAPLKEEGKKTEFLRFAASLDSLRLPSNPFPDEFYLALFLLPLLDHFCPAGEFPEGRRGQADFLLRVRQWVSDTLGPLHFTRQAKEGATQLLSAQRIFREFRPQGKLPLRLVRKPSFQPALHLFELGAKIRGEEPAPFSWSSSETPFHRRRKKHRPRYPRGKGGGGKPPAVETASRSENP